MNPNCPEIVRKRLIVQFGQPPPNLDAMAAEIKALSLRKGQPLTSVADELIAVWRANPETQPK